VYLLVDPGILSSPLNFYAAPRFVLPIGWMPLTDTTDKATNERTDRQTEGRTDRLRDRSLSLSSFVCLLEFDTSEVPDRPFR